MTSSARTRVLDFLDEWTRRGYQQPHAQRLQTWDDDETVELLIADLYILCDALKDEQEPPEDAVVCPGPDIVADEYPEEQYAIEVPELTPSGLTEGLDCHPITTDNGRKFLVGDCKLAFREALLWRASERDPWQVILTGPLGVDG